VGSLTMHVGGHIIQSTHRIDLKTRKTGVTHNTRISSYHSKSKHKILCTCQGRGKPKVNRAKQKSTVRFRALNLFRPADRLANNISSRVSLG
jgi:hypothetical protein